MKVTSKMIIKRLVLFVIVSIIGFFAVRYYVYHGGTRNVESEKAVFTMSIKDIVAEFTANETEANKKYVNKTVAISGVITSVNGKEVILDEIGVCNFLVEDTSLKKGDKIVVKGRVVGYDDILGGLNLDQCSINK